MTQLISTPGTDTVDRFENGRAVEVNAGWRNFFVASFNILSGITMSGTTAQRPTKLLWTGRPYFDTSLAANGRPIWVDETGAGWVDADGNPV